MLKRLCERLDIYDLLQLMAGHFSVFRKTHRGRLQLTASRHILAPRRSTAWIARIVNSSIRVRVWLRKQTYLRCRRRFSQMKWWLTRGLEQHACTTAATTFSLLCPSRGRVSGAESLIRSVCRTAFRPERVELLFYVDSDDPCLPAYRELFATTDKRFGQLRRCVLVVDAPTTVGKAWNILARAAEGDVLMMANDDQLYVDYGWDDHAAEALARYPDRMVCMFFDNGQYTGGGGDFPIMPRRWFEVLGYFAPEVFAFWANDQWILDVAARAGRMHAIKGVFVDHLHYSEYRSPYDETYQRYRLAPDKWNTDAALFEQTAQQRAADACRVRETIAMDMASAS